MNINENLQFQYCQKLILFNEAEDKVLLARRKNENDYDGVYSFIGGKMEVSDGGFETALKREKEEEIGKRAIVLASLDTSYNVYYTKKDGSAMILPHLYAKYKEGEIILNEEYSDYQWVALDRLDEFEPKIATIPQAVKWAQKMKDVISDDSMTRL